MAEVIEIAHLGLHDQVVGRLRTMLIEGRIAPGAKLNERELCELLHVSRTPLREAIKLLAAEGLVDLLPNRGATAVRLGEADVQHTFEVLTRTYASINARVQSLRFRTNQNAARWKQAVKEHERIVDALTAHDATATRAILVEHLQHKRDTVLDLLRAGDVYPPAASTRPSGKPRRRV